MKCFNRLLSHSKVHLAVFMLILICTPIINMVPKVPNESEVKKMLKESLKETQKPIESEYMEPKENVRPEIKMSEAEPKNEIDMLVTIQRNYSILVALVAICGGFILAATFLLFSLAYNKQTLSEISSASLHIVKSLQEVTTSKVAGGDILTMHI